MTERNQRLSPQERVSRRQTYWHGQLEAAYGGPPDDQFRDAFAVLYRWIVAETSRRRTGRAQAVAEHVLVKLMETMETAADTLTRIDAHDLEQPAAAAGARGEPVESADR